MKPIAYLLSLMFFFVGTAWAAVNINTATQSELEAVKGLGPAKAKLIIDYRDKNGPFKSLEDLDKVKGFGKATIEKLRPDLTVSAVDQMAPDKGGAKEKPGK